MAAFIDWQNSYHLALRGFHPAEPAIVPVWAGQFHPRQLAELLVSKGPGSRVLTHLGIYTGRPDPRKDPKTYAAHMRQCATWERECGELLRLRTRTLRYLPGRAPDEKGIDVQFAIDVMLMAVRQELDVALLITADNDLLPVVEGLLELQKATGHPEVEVVGWAGVQQKLTVAGVPVRWVGPLDYRSVQDTTDYNVAMAGRKPVAPGS